MRLPGRSDQTCRETALDAIKINDLREIGFVRQKNVEPHLSNAQA